MDMWAFLIIVPRSLKGNGPKESRLLGSEGSFRPNAKKSEKSLETGSWGLPAPGGEKVRKSQK